MPGFFSNIIDQAQNAVQSSPLANKLPGGHNRPASPGVQDPNTANTTLSGIRGSSTFAAINHQFRTLKEQYGDSTPYQRMITTSKGVIMDFDGVGKDAKANSKELYIWGQTETEDLKDVTDRLAYFQFVQGSLAESLAKKLNAARLPLKNLRDKEDTLAARRNIRNNYELNIAKLETSSGNQKKINELEELLRKANIDDDPLEKEVQILERKAIKESEHAKWEAFREYGEKLAILAQASEQLLQVLPSLPPSPTRKYEGGKDTAALRAAVQKALDNWKPGQTDFPVKHDAVDLDRSDTKSFGETHANELSTIGQPAPSSSRPKGSGGTTLHDPPVPIPTTSQDTSSKLASSPPVSAPPLQPESLNLSPAPLPAPTITPSDTTPAISHTSGSDPIDPPAKFPQVTPTVAETGVPKSAGPDGPGPASGSLLDVKADHGSQGGAPGNASGSTPKPYESAEDEKKRLEREERERVLNQGPSATPPKFATAEEEKKRLEREEREKILADGGNANPAPGSEKPDENQDDLPPYKEF
ncbi:Eisosome component PIL1-domain-containing protein [Thelephora terrestris]|uniref:Eisosome component PIL1-domain-containing protein n=1 Tax=Thelephora terrestris TaxID=56493 RepID=A0A9P6HF00_9AGAM|nr:Eisosome component PIL1-domain-containing protein [Thelephora terrestris]